MNKLNVKYEKIGNLHCKDNAIIDISLLKDYSTALNNFESLNNQDIDIETTVTNLNNILSVFGIQHCDYEKPLDYLTFTAIADNDAESTISLTKIGEPDPIELVYSLNNGKNGSWLPYEIGTEIKCQKNKRVMFAASEKGNANFSKDLKNYYQFSMTGKFAASGNIQSLLDNTCEKLEVYPYCYANLFLNCRNLTSTPKLPATTLAEYCYKSMFHSCHALLKATELPATELAEHCYHAMFQDC